jgi:hypothetical protein
MSLIFKKKINFQLYESFTMCNNVSRLNQQTLHSIILNSLRQHFVNIISIYAQHKYASVEIEPITPIKISQQRKQL